MPISTPTVRLKDRYLRSQPMQLRLFPYIVLFLTVVVLAAAQSPVSSPEPEGFTITRSACATDCPIYSLRIDRSGVVTYDGKGFVKVFGQKTWSIPVQSAE